MPGRSLTRCSERFATTRSKLAGGEGQPLRVRHHRAVQPGHGGGQLAADRGDAAGTQARGDDAAAADVEREGEAPGDVVQTVQQPVRHLAQHGRHPRHGARGPVAMVAHGGAVEHGFRHRPACADAAAPCQVDGRAIPASVTGMAKATYLLARIGRGRPGPAAAAALPDLRGGGGSAGPALRRLLPCHGLRHRPVLRALRHAVRPCRAGGAGEDLRRLHAGPAALARGPRRIALRRAGPPHRHAVQIRRPGRDRRRAGPAHGPRRRRAAAGRGHAGARPAASPQAAGPAVQPVGDAGAGDRPVVRPPGRGRCAAPPSPHAEPDGPDRAGTRRHRGRRLRRAAPPRRLGGGAARGADRRRADLGRHRGGLHPRAARRRRRAGGRSGGCTGRGGPTQSCHDRCGSPLQYVTGRWS